MSSGPNTLNYAIYDAAHWDAPRPRLVYTTELPTNLMGGALAYLFQRLMKDHRGQNCACCKGRTILFKTAWRVKLPVDKLEFHAPYLPWPLEHDPSADIRLLDPAENVSATDFRLSEPGVNIHILFETTYEPLPPRNLPQSHTLKRSHEDTESNDHEPPDINRGSNGIAVVDSTLKLSPNNNAESSHEDVPMVGDKSDAQSNKIRKIEGTPLVVHELASPADSVALPQPDTIFFSQQSPQSHIPYVNKARYLTALNRVLASIHCGLIISPPKTGKSNVLAMLNVWYDLHTDTEELERLFSPLIPQLSTEKLTATAKTYLCLSFDFNRIQISSASDEETICSELDGYWHDVIMNFANKYSSSLPNNTVKGIKERTPVQAVQYLADQLHTSGKRLFVSIDHADAPLLSIINAMVSQPGAGQLEASQRAEAHIAHLVHALIGLCGTRGKIPGSKMLINSVLPKSSLKGWDNATNVTAYMQLAGLYGITEDETEKNLRPLSHQSECNTESFPSIAGSFKITTQFNVGNVPSGAMGPASSPLINWIVLHCVPLLQDSNLRYSRYVHLSRRQISSYTRSKSWLTDLFTDDGLMWRILLSHGYLRVIDYGGVRPDSDPVWKLAISSPLFAIQLFINCPVASLLHRDSLIDMQLRALLGGDTFPFTEALSTELCFRAYRTLWSLSEAAFHMMVEDHILFRDPTYRKHVFSEVRQVADLNTADKISVSGRHLDKDTKHKTHFKFLDILLCDLGRLNRNRAMVVELKSFCTQGFIMGDLRTPYVPGEFNAKYSSDEEMSKACIEKAQQLATLSYHTLLQQSYARYNQDSMGYDFNNLAYLVREAETQLRTYCTLLAAGQAGPSRVGVSDRRVVVGDLDTAEEVIGITLCAVGSRVISTILKPIPTKFSYKGVPQSILKMGM
ncbi:hypothetical protein MIND_00157500 [Mycena indigotica]|uniref:AAA-ATPase-like domain-containing protein n=1 Tax=Mycena indigotica TaxID=2126181 RepID=A0A8H6TGM2_9AGAR|nr:uncharacterized protein MIND_00157500 [Mycena indigotica]KAF7316387.1 hypothetical protein MIND_00157500 [Mycena indigotica]